MWTEFGLDWVDAARVVASSIFFYVAVLLLVRFLGQRTLATLSSFDLAAIIALGAVIGRAILGDTPTLFAGLLGLATLLSLQVATGQLRRSAKVARVVSSPAVLLMAGSRLLDDNLARAHIIDSEVYSQLRLAGIRSLAEVACVILEPTGQISVLRRGETIDPRLLADVIGGELVPPTFIDD
ncbi:DUF421 domain-containing protein [Cryobacterium psychrophilum]|uniref:DUF421 domain-containing protein n=1 Tax=Cryobacterium psychrophilum TaxID=41988 RepID=A0A4Y8KI51_9MICO|nr:YetF domain-containing protein [Cryobacterium psychrophilum]TDW28432.1 uncharacterized membrane protein YcaP (DUF421 family) [Cryobacterium psychrophilum]TFD75130.1 DUF421 domain-containing protein [Cryobacterium psychrophilum]